jgi:hypothetical protein
MSYEALAAEPAPAETKATETPGEADAKPEEKVVEESAPSAPETSAAPEDKVQARFDKLTREKYDALREADYWRDRAQRQPEIKPEPVKQTPAPTLEAFEYDQGKYQAALIEFAKQQAREEAKATLRAEREELESQAKRATFEIKQTKFLKSNPDYAEKVLNNPRLPVTPEMAKVIWDSDIGPEIALYLADNEEQARAIAFMPQVPMARELGRIEAKLEIAKTKAPPPVSKAPPPTPKIDATDPAVEKEPSDMTDKEYAKWRQRQIAQRKAWRRV